MPMIKIKGGDEVSVSMEQNRTSRRLAAIMYTDMVGFTALSQRDEALSIKMLEDQRSLVRPIVKSHGGREVKTMGDGFLVVFPSALEATKCAYDIQKSVREFNSPRPQSKQMGLRVGIHLGDVIEDGDDISGDAVNVASRVQPLAEEGGVCLTRQVYDQVANKFELKMSSMGLVPLKNVGTPLEIFKMEMPWGAQPAPRTEGLNSRRIAVLPFANLSPDPGDEYFADGLTEELISHISGVPGLQVISRTSAMHFKKSPKTTREIASELNTGSLLEGSVRKAGDKVRVTVQLVDGKTDTHVWGGNFDRKLEDVFAMQDEIARSVVESLKLKLLAREEGEKARETQNVSAYVAYLKGRSLLRDGTEASARAAKGQFEEAVSKDLGYAKAYAGLADSILALGDYLFAPFPKAIADARESVDKALALDPELDEARVSFANLLTYEYKFHEAEKEYKKAIECNPNNASAHLWYSLCLQALGRMDQGMEEALEAEKLDPLSPAITLSVIYRMAYQQRLEEAEKRLRKLEGIDPAGPLLDEARMVMAFARKDWEEAAYYVNKMKEKDPTDPFLDADLGYLSAITGRREEALRMAEKLKAVPEDLRIKGNLLAFVYAGLGDLDTAFYWLFKSAEWKETFVGWDRYTPFFEQARADPRFKELLARMGVAE
jgi:adenylate cyclase